MNNKKIDIKYFYFLIVICLVLGACLLFKNHDKPKKENNNEVQEAKPVTKSIAYPYDVIFNSFTGVSQVMNVDGNKIVKKDLSQDDEFNIITQLLTKDDYTDSKEKSEFNEELAKYRTIKKSTLDRLLNNYFADQFSLPEQFFIFPYQYTLTGDSYIGEAIITGLVGEPGWQYQAVSYTLSKDKLAIDGFAYYDDFYENRICKDEQCLSIVNGANYDNLLDYQDSFTKITVHFARHDKEYRFIDIVKGE